MKFYLEMMKKTVFTSEDIEAVYTNDKSGNNYVLKLVSERRPQCFLYHNLNFQMWKTNMIF